MALLAVLLLAVVAGALVYSALVVFAAHHYLAVKPPGLRGAVPVSVLKPLAGAEDGLERNLRSFFELDYPDFELLFAVREPADPAAGVVERLRREYPGVAARLIVTGEPPYPNAKVFSLDRMLAEAGHDLLVMSDSDVRVTPDMLRIVAAEFQDERLGLATCPYRAVPGRGFWSLLEAIGMNTEFLSGILVAKIVEGMKFAVGPTIVARRAALASIGGLVRVKDFLAEDFVLGKLVAESGWRVALSSYVIEHHIGGEGLAASVRHRLRWVRSTRRSRPSGYIGQVFTYPLPLALLLVAVESSWWPLLIAAALLRALSAWAVAGWVLRDSLTLRRWYLVPVEDLVSFAFWMAGFFGNTIQWRGRTYCLRPDGRFELRK
ncbi:MAG: bacteriohopanetetrol glucosamine biosynthesis glycosyltransferase HpnI [Bryobacteraceae bacterium]